MKHILSLLLMFGFAGADYIKQTSLGCPTIQAIKNAPKDAGDSGMDITLYSMANDCLILNTKEKVTAIDYRHDSKAIFQEIRHKKTDKTLYILRKNIVFEQGGNKNIFKF